NSVIPSGSEGSLSTASGELDSSSSASGGLLGMTSTPSATLTVLPSYISSYSAMLAQQTTDNSKQLTGTSSSFPSPLGEGQGEVQQLNNLTIEQSTLFKDALSVLGLTTLGQTVIAGPLSQDGTLVFDNGNEINAIGQTLYIQKLALGGVDFFNGKVTLSAQGDMMIAGNLAVGGTLTANVISPVAGKDLEINLSSPVILRDASPEGSLANASSSAQPAFAGDSSPSAQNDNGGSTFGQLLVRGVNGDVVVGISATGSASFAGNVSASSSSFLTSDIQSLTSKQILAQAATFGRLTIDTGLSIPQAQAEASGSATEITANGAIGRATIAAGYTYLIIHNSALTPNSLIYLTPTSRSLGLAPFVSEVIAPSAYTPGVEPGLNPENTPGMNVLPDRYFKVEIDHALPSDLTFNWLIVN
ncbi:MAG: hypothetical protein M1120_03325, partial [Patescibacteria group bacterium]|nr:hypothetical protein [Patescibacteria group bacterium]